MLFNPINHVLCRDSDIVSGSPPIVDEVATDDNTITDKAPEKDEPKPEEPKDEAKPEAKPEGKSPEKEQLFQERYQNFLAYIEQTEPHRVEEFKQAAKQALPKVDQPGALPGIPTTDQPMGGVLTSEDIQVLTDNLVKANQASLLEIKRQESIDREKAGAGQSLVAQAKEYGLTTDDLNKAITEAGKLVVSRDKVGDHSRWAAVALEKMRLMAFEKGIVTRTQEAATSAADQARNMVATEQPAKGAPPTKPKETEEQKTLREINEVRGRPAHTLLDSELRPRK